jgi:hypothetical protein
VQQPLLPLCLGAGIALLRLVADALSASVIPAGDRSGAQIVDDTLRQAASRGMNTVRMWAHTTTALYPFQVRFAGQQQQQQHEAAMHSRGPGMSAIGSWLGVQVY